jgi:hypothetical protein
VALEQTGQKVGKPFDVADIVALSLRLSRRIVHVLEMREALEWQFFGGSKYFRRLTIFACHRAVHGPGPTPPRIMTSALVIEFFHNVRS